MLQSHALISIYSYRKGNMYVGRKCSHPYAPNLEQIKEFPYETIYFSSLVEPRIKKLSHLDSINSIII